MIGWSALGKYVLLTVAHNFEVLGKKLLSAVFILHRDGRENYTAVFKVVKNTIMVHPEYNSQDGLMSEQEGIF